MIQDEFREQIFKFVQYASVEEVAYIFLFGSVAKGDADRRSDIDIFIVLDTYDKNFEDMEAKVRVSELALALEREYDRSIQLVFTNRNYTGLDEHFIEEVFKEGLLLYAKSPLIKAGSLKLEHYIMIIFSLEGFNSSDKMRIKRILYGYSSQKIVGSKRYESKKIGLVQKLQGLRIGAGVIAIPSKNVLNMEKELNRLKLTFKKIDLWLTGDSIKKLQELE